DETGHDERAVAHALNRRHSRPDGRAEHDEIEGGRNHRRHDALEQRTKRARHFELVDGEDGRGVHDLFHFFCTRLTKISSRELCRVWRSRKAMPISSRAFKSAVIRARSASASNRYTSFLPSGDSSSRYGASASGTFSRRSASSSESSFFPSFCMRTLFSSTKTSSPPLMTPIRSASSSASWM